MTTQTIRIVIDASGATSGANQVNSGLNSITSNAQQTSNGLGQLGAALAALGVVELAKKLGGLADSFNNINGKLSLVTTSTSQLADVQAKLFDVAQQTRAGFEGVVDLYTSLARSTKALGVSQGDLVQVTKTINQALIVSGASAETAKGALVQLGQGFASGTLRGDELNSVLEGTPRLASAIADGMGVTVGQLRALGAQGKITGETVFNALLSQKDVVEKEFAKMPVTIAQSFITLQNEVLKYVGQTDKASGVSTVFVGIIATLAQNIDLVATALALLGATMVTKVIAPFGIAAVAAVAETTALLGCATAAEVAALAFTQMGTAALAAVGGPVVVGIVALGAALVSLYSNEQNLNTVMADVNKTFADHEIKLQLAGKASQLAGHETNQFGEYALSAKAPTDGMAFAAGALADQYYRTADGAKKARIEIAQTAQLKAASNLKTIQDANNPFAALSRSDVGIGEGFKIAGHGALSAIENATNGGKTAREDAEAETKAKLNLINANKDLADAYISVSDAKKAGAGPNSAEIASLRTEIAELTKLKALTSGKKSDDIQKRIDKDNLEIKYLGTGVSKDSAQFAAGAGGGKSAADTAASKAATERAAALKALMALGVAEQNNATYSALTTEEARRQKALNEAAVLAKKAGLDLTGEVYQKEVARINAAEDIHSLNDLINDSLRENGKILDTNLTKLEKEAKVRQGIADSLSQRYDRDQDSLNQVNLDRLKLNEVKDQFSPEEFARIGKNIDEEGRKAALAIGQTLRDEGRNAIIGLASLFGDEMGSAVTRIVNILDSIDRGTFDGSQIGGVVGKLTAFATSLTGGSKGDVAKSIGAAFEKQIKNPLGGKFGEISSGLKDLKSGFSKGGDLVKGISGALGTAFAGAQQGELAGSLVKALGLKGSKTGSQIGGAVGSFLPIPGGALIGGAIGSIVGGLFKKPQTGGSTITNATDVGVTSGNSSKLKTAATGLSGSVQSSLQSLATALGGSTADFSGITIGQYKDKYRVNTSGTKLGGSAGIAGLTDFGTGDAGAAAAVTYATSQAIAKGAITGISDFSKRVLSAAKDLDTASALALKYENVVKTLDNITDPISSPLRDLAKSFSTLKKEMSAAGATTDELANVDKLYNIQLQQTKDAQLDSLKALRDSLQNGGLGQSALSKYQTAQSALDGFKSDIASGKSVDSDKLATAVNNVTSLASQLYGTSTTEFQSINDSALALVNSAIGNVQTAQDSATAAAVPVVSAINTATDQAAKDAAITQDLLKQIAAAFGNTRIGNALAAQVSAQKMVNGKLVQA